MDRMLHRGKYRREGKELIREKITLRNAFRKLMGIDSQYTTGDKILAWSVVVYSFGWGFLITVVGVVVWNRYSPWPIEWWEKYYFITIIVVGMVIGTISTVWFMIGGMRDLLRMFKDIAVKETDILDDGRVIRHVNADDVTLVEQIDNINTEDAHIEDQLFEEELEDERHDKDNNTVM